MKGLIDCNNTKEQNVFLRCPHCKEDLSTNTVIGKGEIPSRNYIGATVTIKVLVSKCNHCNKNSYACMPEDSIDRFIKRVASSYAK